jgi:hypothetical protein
VDICKILILPFNLRGCSVGVSHLFPPISNPGSKLIPACNEFYEQYWCRIEIEPTCISYILVGPTYLSPFGFAWHYSCLTALPKQLTTHFQEALFQPARTATGVNPETLGYATGVLL